MTEREIIAGVLTREGGFVNHPADKGGPTNWGITAKTLGTYRKLGRDATVNEVSALTQPDARDIYQVVYINQPAFTPEVIPFEPLRVQLIDFGINSGPALAIRWLQRVLRVTPTGRLDADTRNRLWACHTLLPTLGLALVNDALVAARAYMIDRVVDADTSQRVFEEGLESRALGFLLATPDHDVKA